MTLAILYGDSPFVFIARDRRVSWPRQVDGSWVAMRGESESPCVHAHRNGSIIWAITGLAAADTDERISRAISKIRGPLASQLVPALVASLDADAQNLIRAEETRGYDDLMGRNVLGVFMGIHENGSAAGVYLEFRKDGPWATNTMGHRTETQHTKEFFKQIGREVWPRDGEHATDHLRDVCMRAIEAAEKVAGGPADVGGPVDLGVVGPLGAGVYSLNKTGAHVN